MSVVKVVFIDDLQAVVKDQIETFKCALENIRDYAQDFVDDTSGFWPEGYDLRFTNDTLILGDASERIIITSRIVEFSGGVSDKTIAEEIEKLKINELGADCDKLLFAVDLGLSGERENENFHESDDPVGYKFANAIANEHIGKKREIVLVSGNNYYKRREFKDYCFVQRATVDSKMNNSFSSGIGINKHLNDLENEKNWKTYKMLDYLLQNQYTNAQFLGEILFHASKLMYQKEGRDE